MSPNESQKLPATWSAELLSEFHKLINSPLPLSFTISEKNKSTTFFGKNYTTLPRSRKTSLISYRGGIAASRLDHVNVIFYPVNSFSEEYKNFVGYIEIANSSKEETVSFPEIRVFIPEDSGICEIFNEMLTESKMFNSKISPVYIYLEQSFCLKDKSPDELLKKKIPIKEMSTFQKISCTE